MKNTVRVSFDVPINEHTFLKTECTKARIPFRNVMQEAFHKTVQEFKKKEFQEKLNRRINNSKKSKKGREITLDYLDQMEDIVDDHV